MRLALLTRICAAVLTFAVVTTKSVHAGVIVDNGTSTSTGGFDSNDDAQVFDDFTLSLTETLKAIEFEAVIADSLTSITISVWRTPNSGLLHSADFAIGVFESTFNADAGKGRSNYTLSTDLPDWTLGPDTYWLSIYGDDYLLSPLSSGSMAQVRLSTNTLINSSQTAVNGLPFRLYGASLNASVPEPSSIAIWSLLGLGLVGYGRRRKRLKK